MFNCLTNYFNRIEDRLKRANYDQIDDRGLHKFHLICSIVGFLIFCIYMAIVILIIEPKFKAFINSEATRFPDPMTPRVNFLATDYDNEQERAKSVIIDVGRCAGIIQLDSLCVDLAELMERPNGTNDGLTHYYTLGEDKNWRHALVCKPDIVS